MKVLLATVLKPIDDTRMSEKLVQIFQSYQADIQIFGRKVNTVAHSFSAHDAHITGRKLTERIKAQYYFGRTIIALKPTHIVVGAIELLWVAFLFKPYFKYKLIYDIRENYRRNIWYQSVYSLWQKPILYAWVYLTEWISPYVVDEFWLAEACYADELSFFKKKTYCILENKFAGNPPTDKLFPIQLSDKSVIHFALVGTLSSTFGAMSALIFFEQYSQKYDARLTVAGMIADQEIADKLATLSHKNIECIISEKPIPHTQIIEVMQRADVVMLPYLPNKSTENCIPTKLYECLALGIPMLIRHNPRWQLLTQKYQAAIFTSFSPDDIDRVANQLRNTVFYPDGYAKEAYFGSVIKNVPLQRVAH